MAKTASGLSRPTASLIGLPRQPCRDPARDQPVPPALINGSAKSGRLRGPGDRVAGKLPCPGLACRWR